MKLPAQPSCALDDDDAASLEASLLEDVAPPEREKEDNTVAILCAAGAAVGALVFGYSLGFSSPALPGMRGAPPLDAPGAQCLQRMPMGESAKLFFFYSVGETHTHRDGGAYVSTQ